MKCSVEILVFVFGLLYVNAKPVDISVELLTDGAMQEISNAVENMEFADIQQTVGDFKVSFENMKVSRFDADSMKLIYVDGGYKAKFIGVAGVIESDVKATHDSKEASAHIVGDIYNLRNSDYDVTMNVVGGQIKPEVTGCNVDIEEYDLSMDLQGEPYIQAFISDLVNQSYKALANQLSKTYICAIVKPEIQKLVDGQNFEEILG